MRYNTWRMSKSAKRPARRINRGPVGANLRRIRIEKNLTQEGVAAKSGVSRSTVADIERGDRGATAETLHGLATALDVSLDEFYAPIRTVSIDGRLAARS
jgi:transcriptional regulator with XRE-family HTH domain